MEEFAAYAERSGVRREAVRAQVEPDQLFAEAVIRLQHGVEQARSRLAEAGIHFEDRSGSFGRDARYRWCFHFEQHQTSGPEIVIVSADIICLESQSSAAQAEVETRWTAEVFQPGQPPRFKHDSRSLLALAQVLSGDLTALIHGLLRQAETALPPAAGEPQPTDPAHAFFLHKPILCQP
jgi:hypothetical protein